MVIRPVYSSKVVQHPSTGEAMTRQNYRELLARIKAQNDDYKPLQPKENTNV